jgi:hypothetical protein
MKKLLYTLTLGLSLFTQADELQLQHSYEEEAEELQLESSQPDLETIGKMTANPLGAAWMLWAQNDYRQVRGDAIKGSEDVNLFKFQPVMSIPFEFDAEDWNLILRPVVQYNSTPQNDRTNGFGDTALLTLVGPDKLDGAVWGVGFTQIFPTAEHEVLGQEKWQAGPAFLIAHLAPNVGGWNYGALGQHWWSYAGEDDRESTSFTDVQYFLNYRLSKTELLGMSPNITYDWEADSDNALTVPVGLGYSDIYMIGKMPVRIAFEAQYAVVRPDDFGYDWNFRILFIPVIKNPLRD